MHQEIKKQLHVCIDLASKTPEGRQEKYTVQCSDQQTLSLTHQVVFTKSLWFVKENPIEITSSIELLISLRPSDTN